MPFTQNFYGSIGTNTNIENLNGTLTINGRDVLTANSSPRDLSEQLKQLAISVDALVGIPAEAKAKAVAEILAADEEAQSNNPKGRTIKSHMDTASGALKSATEVASGAFSLGKVLLEVGKWAIAIFA